MAVLVLADTDGGKLTGATARVVAAAGELGPVDLLVEAGAADEARGLSGIAKVIAAEMPASADALAPMLAAMAEGYSHVVAAANSLGRDVIPRLGALLDIQPITDVTAIFGPQQFERPTYAGNAVETVRSGQAKQLLTVRASAWSPVRPGGPAPVHATEASAVEGLARRIAEHRTESDRPDLATAAIVVAGGVSLGSAEKFALISELAAKLGAAVGATRAAVDAGYAPNDWQVGQTGKIVAPDLYIGIGISGALQHLAGIQGAKTIVAINRDADAPLMKIADYAVVGDLFTVVPALVAELDRLDLQKR